MKRKYFLVVLFLVLAIFLSGCGVTTPAMSDEAQITNRIGQFCVALSDKNFDLAKSYCYPGSSAYLMIEQFESMIPSSIQMSDVTVWIYPAIYSIDITGNEATAIVSFNMQVLYQGQYLVNEETELGIMKLIKSGGEWYFYY
ncbi:hypothetical protein ES707_09405 [subsurface metagenome]